jgi:hypothetical protein
MLARQAAEEGRELSNEEQQLAKVQYHEWWQEQYRSLMGAAGAQSASGRSEKSEATGRLSGDLK